MFAFMAWWIGTVSFLEFLNAIFSGWCKKQGEPTSSYEGLQGLVSPSVLVHDQATLEEEAYYCGSWRAKKQGPQVEKPACKQKYKQERKTFLILPPFPCGVKKATALLEQWVKDLVVHSPFFKQLLSQVDKGRHYILSPIAIRGILWKTVWLSWRFLTRCFR